MSEYHQLPLFAPDAPVCPFPGEPCVLHIHHEGEPKMVGKIIRHVGSGEMVFYHAAGRGSQWHRNHDCPAPLDCLVVAALLDQKLRYVYHYDRERETLFRAVVVQILNAPVETYGGRRRHYLPVSDWKALADVTETMHYGTRTLHHDGRPIFVVPFLKKKDWVLEP